MNILSNKNFSTSSLLTTSKLTRSLFVLILTLGLPFFATAQVANDDCAGAIDLGTLATPANCGNGPNNNGQGADQVNTGLTNINAVAENPYSAIIGCQGTGNPDMASPAADVWYSVTVTGNELDVTITGLQDPNVGIYSGACGALTPLGCAVGSGGLLQANFQTIVAGQTIYIQVSGGGVNDTGNFNMTLANHISCDDCILGDQLTVSPQPVNGTYQPGTAVTFCYQITEFSQENTNWLHGVIPVFGAGWDMSTLTVNPPPTCDGGLGQWFWINNVPTPDGPQSGFWFDGDLFNAPDGDPTNNYGDNCQGNINPNDWNFCWTIEPVDCIEGADLGISIMNYADGETGSWVDVACTGDPTYDFFSTLTCCPDPDTLTVPETCFGACDGSATVDGNAGGAGTGPWDYVWVDGGGTQIASQNNVNGPSTQTGLCAGTYTVTVTDANNCTVTIDVNVSAPPQIVVTAGGTPSACAGTPCNGTLTSNATGGAGGFSYSWDNGIGTGQNQSGVCAGTYTVTATDANGCTATATFTVTAPPVLAVTATATNETCDGLCDGTVSAGNATGGTPPYTYAWDGGLGAGQNVGGACDGTYTVTVTDANNCTATAQVTVNPGIIVTADFNPVANQCLTGNSFDFTDNSTNATGYSWTFPGGTPGTSTAQNPTGVTWGAAGTYTITLVASNGTCTDTYTQDITVYDEPVVTITSTNISCNGVCDGQATANATGGGGGYSYSWDNGAGNNAIANNLCPGTYTVTVTDANNCVGTAQVTITEPPVLAVTAAATDASCFGVCDGTLSANNATGGTAPYTYTWDGGVGAGQNQTGVCAGTYTATVTDANGCTATATVTINEPPVLVASATATNATCNGVCDGTLGSSVTGGVGPYTYSWDGGIGAGQNPTGVCAGTYTVTVTDANGCTSTATATVNEPPLLTVTATATDELCNGSCDGSLSASGSGGTGAISYSWDGGIGAGANQSNVCAGTYTVTATDANGCTATATVTINTPPVLTVTITGNDASCNGVCDGDAAATASGGTGPYTYQWDANGGLGTNASATGLCASTVGVTVTDANGCTATATFVINEPTPIVLTTSSVNPNCGNSDGSATVSASGGSGGYTYSWSPAGGTGATASNLPAGGYTVTVTDAAGCVETATVTLTDNGAPTATITAQTDVNCFGGNNGSLTVTATGGAGGYTYSWAPTGGTGATATGLIAGTYTVTVTDAVGCVATATATIIEPPLLTGAITGQSEPLCAGSCDGTATVTATGGTPPYNYLWSTGGNTANEIGMCDGAHTVQITDANGCAIVVPVTITDPPVLAGTIVPTDALCAGSCDGSADLTVTGGTPPYTYLWSTAGTSEDETGLCAGGYNVTITDANGCTVNVATTIGEPLPLALTTTTVDPTCGQSNGQACVTATDGTGPYTYLWNDGSGQTTACADNIPAGGYQVTVTDANGCVATANVTLTDQAGGTASAVVDQEPLCAGACDGQATVTMTGGTGPFTYLWTPGNFTNATETALCAGTYNIQVTDANNCVTNTTVTLTDPSGLAVTVVGTDPLCFGSCDGSADVTVAGGTAPYTYVWNHGPTAEDLTGVLCDGSYTVTVTDANGCQAVGNVTITDPPVIVIPAPVVNNVLCNGACDGDATAAPTGGTGTLTYNWVNDATGTSVGTTATASNLCAGTYTLTVTDANGCTETANITVTEPPVITLTTSTVNSNCGQADGEVSVIATGGSGGFTYDWQPGGLTNATETGLASGTYTVTVTDANGCTETATATIVDNASGTAAAAVDNNVSCAAGCDGQATASMTGGTGPFTYQWDAAANNQTTATATGLCAGTYTVDITDANGCLASTTVTITEPLPLVVTPSAVDASCNGFTDGSVDVVATDGTGPYTYSWIDQGTGGSVGTTANVAGLPAGTYCVTVTDANGCTDTQCITINEPTAIVVNTAMTDASCGQSDGSVSATATGGSGTYVSYDWTSGGNPVGNGTTVAGVPAGSYDVLVTDDTGCTGTATVAVGDLAGPTLVFVSSTDVSCNGGSDGTATVNATGGTGAITYDWQPIGGTAATATGLPAGTYTVTATDANGCVDNIVVTINEPTPVVASITASTDVSGFGLCDGDATASGSGGTAPYTYQWYDDNTYTNPMGTNATQTGLCAQEYCVIITDANGCQDSICVTIIEPPALIINVTSTDALCIGACDGTADVTAAGGVGPYTYQWYQGAQPGSGIPGATSTNVTGLCAGTYYVEVTDANGIVANSADFVINEPPALTAVTAVISDYNGQDISCANACDGAAQITVSGGTAPYMYSWIDIATGTPLGIFTDIASGLCKGTYDIAVTDANGCVDTFQVTLTQPAPLVNVFAAQDVSCPGTCDGWISSAPAGGTAPYAWLWSDQAQQSTDTAINLCAGSYNVTITDVNGCTLTEGFTITEPNPIVLNGTSTGSTCGQADGTATVTIVAGDAPFTYQWDANAGNQTTATATNLLAGCYDVVVTDANFCTDTTTICVQDLGAPSLTVLTLTDVSCNGACDGFAQVQVSGGTPAYAYEWLDANTGLPVNPPINSNNGTNLCAGDYIAQVTDGTGCIATVSVTINEPTELNPTIQSAVDVTCFGYCDGEATVFATGATPPYTYLWNDISNQTTATATGLCPGTYSVIVTDANNCDSTITVTINEPLEILLATTGTDAFCNTASGSAYVTVTNGVAPFTYLWDAAAGNQASDTAINLMPGTYTVTVTDINGCMQTATVTIGNIPPSIISIASSTNVSCNGGADGTAVSSIGGTGTPPYTYEWFDAATGLPIGQTGPGFDTATALAAGDYYVVATDVNNCVSISDTVTIIEPTPLTVTTTPVDVSCKNICDGSALATPAGGTAPYQFQWNDGLNQITANAINLCDSTYTVTVTDDNGCVATAQAVINEPTQLVLDSTVVNANCGQADGSGCVLASGGSGGYTYLWPATAGSSTNSCVANLPAGTYLVEVTDANACTEIMPVEISDNSGPAAAIVDSGMVSCYNGNDGFAEVGMTGGQGGFFTVLWDANAGNQTTPIATNLGAGTYSVTITDSVGCNASTSVVITDPQDITFIISSVNPTCFGSCDGLAWINVVGGTPPYNYQWLDNGGNTVSTIDTASALCDGDYQLIITDDNGCTAITNFTITEPTLVTATSTSTNVTCFGACDGTGTATAGNGVAPFSYLWDAAAGSQTTATAFGLCPGTYTCTVTDDDGCNTTVQVTITEPPLLTASINTVGHVSCNGVCDGFTQVDVVGGTPPYTYSWNNGALTTQTIQNLCAGTYDVVVTDANNCTATATITITEPVAMAFTTNTVNVNCFGACDGEASINVSGGTPPYTYFWNMNGFPTTPSVTGLCAGTYDVTVTDAQGCQITTSVTITQPTLLGMTVSISDANCGQDNGEICITAVGGAAPYTYQWNDTYSQTTSCADSLFQGCYTVVLTDANGCVVDSTICVNDIAGPQITVDNVVNAACNGDANGSIDITVSSGVPPYTIEWEDGNNNPMTAFANQTTASGLTAQCYTVTVTDAAGCTFSVVQCITEPAPLTSAIQNFTDVSCNLGCDGTALVAVNGGTAPYQFVWNGGNNPTDPQNTGLCAGTYSVTITDANGCTTSTTVTISQPAALAITSVVVDALCWGDCNGSINATVTGGTQPYLYNWVPQGIGAGPLVTNLCAGQYVLDITDANGCTEQAQIIVNEPDSLQLTPSAIPSTCSQVNGAGSVAVVGGTPAYQWLWPNNQTTPNGSGLPAGTHNVAVTDANGCTSSTAVVVTDQPSPVIDSIVWAAPTCNGLANGSATVYHSGGTGAITYLWDDQAGQVSQTAIALLAGNYCVTITDANGCQATQCITITEPNPLIAVPSTGVTICYGDSAQIWANGQGGTPPYTINWQGGLGFTGQGPITVIPTTTTDYCFTVTDANGCVSPSGCVTITVNPPLAVDLTDAFSICDGEDTTLVAVASGGNGGPYTFTWHEGAFPGTIVPGATVGNQSDLAVNVTGDVWYYVVVDDGCSLPVVDSVLVSMNALPIGFLNVVDSSGCAPFTAQFTANSDIGVIYDWDFDCDGTIDMSGTNSSPSWTYTNPGVYDVCVTITSASGCATTITAPALIEVYPVPVAGFIMDPQTTTILNPTITFTDISGGATVYDWDFGDSWMINGPDGPVPMGTNGDQTSGTYANPVHTYLDTGVFTVTQTVTNAYGCSATYVDQITIEGDYILFTPNAFTPDGDGVNDFFFPQGVGIDPNNFEMFIFNRWGEQIFESHDPNEWWDGTVKGTGNPAQIDVYVWLIRTRDHKGEDHEYIGHVTVVR